MADDSLDLFHRTTTEAADRIMQEGRMLSRENTGEASSRTVLAARGRVTATLLCMSECPRPWPNWMTSPPMRSVWA